MILADTDVLIDYLRGRDPAAERVAAELERNTLHTTVVTRFELLSGARTVRELDLVLKLLAVVPALPLDAEAADRAAEMRRGLEASGEAIGMADSLIAGIVAIHRGILLTRNHRHFSRIPDLNLVAL